VIYRLLAVNIDGTLLRSNGRLQSGTKEAIEFVKNKGVYVTLVTNRNFQAAKKIAKALKLNSILITHGGAFISSKLDKPFYAKRISEEKTFNIVQVLENFECNIRLLHERFSIGNRMKLPGNIITKAVLGSGDPLFYPLQFVESLGDSLRDHPVAPPKIEVYFSEREECQRAKKTLEDAFDGIHIISIHDHQFNIVPTGVSKFNGLRTLADILNIPLKETVAIGDSYDDLEMIENVGLGVAMGNAPKEVKLAADWVTRSNNQLGVAYMIKEHFRKQQRIEFLRQLNVKK
jgi:Cof subfamily protein (haloacid dehalogenase superfamily)